MSTHNPKLTSNNKWPGSAKTNRWLWILSCLLLVFFVASLYWGYSERNRADKLENALLDASSSSNGNSSSITVEATQSCEEITEPTEETSYYARGSESIIANFKAAFESGDYEQVRVLFTEDGVLTTAANIHESIMTGDTGNLADRVDEQEFIRLATVHGGQEFTILGDPLMIGDNTLVFAWEWGDGVNGTALLHIRNGKIVICILNPAQYRIPFTGK